MGTAAEVPPLSTPCAECGHPGDASLMLPALEGAGHRCADQESCHDRKEARSAFTTAA
jgi:hypothetical protein